jgi:RHS repeat-associated protein
LTGRSWALTSLYDRPRHALAVLIALTTLALIACQSACDGTIQTARQVAVLPDTPLLAPDTSILGVIQTANSGEVILQFSPETSAAAAQVVGHRYGLEMIGGPLTLGPLPSGRFMFQIPQVAVAATTPTTGRAYFPAFIKPSDRSAYLAQHHLQLIRWIRGMDDVVVAEVRLPAAPLNPTLLDPIAGLFEVALPLGLDLASVSDWAKTLAMRVVSYDPSSGSTIVHPDAWRAAVPRPIPYYSSQRPQSTPPAAAPTGTVYVQFIPGVSADTMGALATKVGLAVTSIGAANLAVLTGDPANARAAIQLLSDNPSVQCVGVAANPCAGAPAPANPTTVVPATPTYGQPASVSASLVNGTLEVSWQAATGATAYAIFSTSSPGGPYQLVAIVAGHDHTSFASFAQIAPGSSVYYQVVAQHPCTQPIDGGTCDVAVVPFGGQGTPAAGWTNPIAPPVPVVPATVVVQTPAPSPVASPAATTQTGATARPSPSTLVAPPASPSPLAPVAPTAATTPPAPPDVVPPPQQTQLGPGPALGPAGVGASAADGHVTVGWQPVAGASAYRVYRSTGGGAAVYLATTSEVMFTDTGGTVGSSYSYQVAAVGGSGLVGTLSDPASAIWQTSSAGPVVLRSLPVEAGVLSGTVRLQVDARSGDGRGEVRWTLSGPAANLTIGTATGLPSAVAPLSWSAAFAWDSSVAPDGAYTITATVTGSSGQQTIVSSTYRIQNAAPIAPINLTAVAQAGGVALTWQQAASAAGAIYRLYRDQPVSGSPLTELSADRQSFVDSNVRPGQHQYQLVLTDIQGRSSEPASSQVTVADAATAQPQAVADLQVLLPTGEALAAGGRVTDRLLLVASAMSGLGFEISSDGKSWSALPQTPTCSSDACTLDLSMDALTSGPYRVRVVATSGASPAHTFVRAAATRYSAPTALVGQVTGLGVQLSWAPPASALPASYQVSRRVQGGDWKLLDQVASTSFIDAMPPAGTATEYRISAVDPEGSAGKPSSPVTVSVPLNELAELQGRGSPAAPTNVQVSAAHGRASLRWDRVAGSDGYLVERQLESQAAFAAAGTTSAASFVDAPSTAAGEIGYRVTALAGAVAGSPSAIATTLVIPTSSPRPLIQSTPTSDRPAAPSSLTAALQAGAVQLSWSAGIGASGATAATPATYNVYRFNPATGSFGLAVSGLETPSFNDIALPAARFGYVITASSAGGMESVFSDPAWLTVSSSPPTVSIQFVAPTPTEASLIQAESFRALAQITAGAGLDQVAFAIAPAGGLWNQLSAVPVDPPAPLPRPATGAAPAALWGLTLNTTSMASGSYKLRVQARDRAGNSQQQVQDLFVSGTAARGPPAFALSANAVPGGVHLQWNLGTTGSFVVQRSVFGPDGPFETVADLQGQQYDDRTALPNQTYAYQVVELATMGSSQIPTGLTIPALPSSTPGGPAVQLGAVSQSELSLAIAAAANIHPLTHGLQSLGSFFEINATSLATDRQVHHLSDQGQVAFALPPGLSGIEAAPVAIYHWDANAGVWSKEDSTVDSLSGLVSAQINHLSEFVLAMPAPTATNGGVAQPPPPPTTPPAQSGAPFQVSNDGEVISMRTANSTVYRNADGSFRTVISTGPVHYKDSTGAWQNFDTTLVPVNPSGTYVQNAAGPDRVQLPADLGAAPVLIQTSAGNASFELAGALHTSRTVHGSAATYQGVFNGVDANYAAVPEGLKESLIITAPPAQTPVFMFNLVTGSLTLRQLADGGIEARDVSGKIQFAISAPWMHDAANAQSPVGATSGDVAVALSGGSGSYQLSYTPNAAWLNDPSRRYPITLDPSLVYTYAYGGEYDDQINNCAPTYNYHTYTYLPIGSTPYSGPCYSPSRAMIQFQNIPVGGTVAYAAGLQLYQYANTNGGGSPIYAEPAALYSDGTAWTSTGVTWNNRPNTTCDYGCPVAYTLGSTAPNWVTWTVTSIVQAWETGAYPNAGFEMIGYENGCSPSCNEEFFASDNYATTYQRPQLTIYWYDESATIGWQGPSHTIVAAAGSLVSVPIAVTNTANALGGNLTWHAYNQTDMVRVGIRDYQTASGAIVAIPNLPNLRTYLPADVAPGGAANLNAVVQVPSDPGDYILRLDLLHETLTSTLWFADRGNQPLGVHVRVLAPADRATTGIPVPLGDGSSLSVNSSNGFASLSATDMTIPERGGARLEIARAFNGSNGLLATAGSNGTSGTGVTNSTYGLGWTFDFQRSVHLGSLGASTYDPSSGILTDAQGHAWTLVWNSARGLYEDAAGDRTVTPSTAMVTTTGSNSIIVPTRPVDLVNGAGMVVTDATAPGGYALRLEGTSGPPATLIVPPGVVPVQQSGTIEFWFRPNFDMSTDTGCHVFFADAQMRFGLAWNCNSGTYPWGSSVSQAIDFFTYDADSATYNILPSAAITWTTASGWHHISITWAESLGKQLMTDTTLVSNSTHSQSPIADLLFGYQPNANGTALNYLNGRIAQLRIDGQVVAGNGSSGTLWNDAQSGTVLSADQYTLYLGHYDSGSPQSAATTYALRNPDQSTETYSSLGVLQNEADRLGNQVDYGWDSSGRLLTIADHSLPSRSITLSYNTNTIVAIDLGGRTVTYQLNANGDLVSVTRANRVPNPLTGVITTLNPATSYSYGTGHLLQQVIDPNGVKTALNYDQSYQQAVLIDGPTAYWRLGESTGATAADSAGTSPGAVVGGVTNGQGGALAGDSDFSYKFNGSTGRISASLASVPAASPYTLEAWVRQSSQTGSQTVLSFAQGANVSMLWLNSGAPAFRVGTPSTFVETASTSPLSPGWHYLAGQYDGSTARLYIDGQMMGTPAGAASGSSGATIWISSQSGSANFFAGNIDEVALYRFALAATRIQAHFTAGRLGVGVSVSGYSANVAYDTPIGYWRLGESAGVGAYDLSGGGNNGTYSGGASLGQAGALAVDPSTAAYFDGSSGTVAISLPSIDTTSGHQITVEFWMYWNANAAAQMPFGFNSYNLFMNSPNVGSFGFNTGCSDAYGVSQVPANTWLHIAAVFTNGGVTSNQIWIDGVQQTLSQLIGTPCSRTVTVAANISGWSGAGTFKFYGNIQDVAVYNGALSSARIGAHYAAGRAAPLSGDPYTAAVISDKPTGYWRLGDASGSTAVDVSGSANSGTYMGAVAMQQPGGLANDVGHATRFDGSTAYVTTPPENIPNAITVEAWVYTSTYNQSGFIVTKNPVNANWELFVQGGTIYWRSGGSGCGYTNYTTMSTPAPSAFAWHHIVAVQSGTAAQIFIDGLQVASSTSMIQIGNGTTSPVNNIDIGRYATSGSCAASYFFNGLIDDVAVYSTALGATRILAHYQASRLAPIPATGTSTGTYPASVTADKPVGYWRLDEPAGIVAQDRSGSNNAGTYSTTGITLGQPGALATDPDPSTTLDGSTGNVLIPASSTLNVAGPLTIEAWINKSIQTTGPIVEYDNGSTYGVHLWNYSTWDSLYVSFMDTSGTGHTVQSAAGLLKTGAWYQVAAVYDGAYGSLYVDGTLVARTYLGSFTPQTSFPLYIGKRPIGPYLFAGSVADVAVYPYALTASRILAHYNAGWDFGQHRVATVQDGRGNTVAALRYNDDLSTTQVVNGRGLPSYYTYQPVGDRTISQVDSGNNQTFYQYDPAAPYRLVATSSATTVHHSSLLNTTAPVGQQSQVLIQDAAGQPSPATAYLMQGGYPGWSGFGNTTLYTSGESWLWDSSVTVQPGILAHRSTPAVGMHEHYLMYSLGTLIPAGSTLSQWVYLEPGARPPDEIALVLAAADGTAWGHAASWGPWNALGETLGNQMCPANCPQSSQLPTPGRWTLLTVSLGPAEGSAQPLNVDMAGRLMDGIAFTLSGGGGAVWWGPTFFTFPGASVSDSTRPITTYAYNSTNDVVASVDPNGVALVRDVTGGLTPASSTGVEPASPAALVQDSVNALGTSAWQQEFGYAGTSDGTATAPQHNGIGSLTQTQSSGGLQSDLYKDFTGFSAGTYVRVSVWVQTSAGGTGLGGASLMVENHLNGILNVQRRSASIQTGGSSWVQLTLPFVVDASGQLRVHLWQENFQGTTTWADLHVDDLTPAPEVTLQHPLGVYASGFEVQPDATWTLGTAATLQDPTQAHAGQFSIKDPLGSSTSFNTVSRTVSLATTATYSISVWVRTVLSGSHGGSGGAQLCVQFTTSYCSPSAGTYTATEGQWQQLSVSLAGSGTLTIQLKHANWQGDVYWDDLNVERIADQTPASSGVWRGTSWVGSLNPGATATWSSSWNGGLAGGPSRQVTITSPGSVADITDSLSTSALRTNASYAFSLWATSTTSNSTITLAAAGQTLSPTCLLLTTPTLCQDSFTYTGADRGATTMLVEYGGQGARSVTISHPLVALASQLFDYTAYGQLSRSHDVFGNATTTTFDSNTLYPTQTVVTATPSPSLTTNFTVNSLGQLILSTKVNGSQSIADQIWLDSWGRRVGDVRNCVAAIAPPSLCNSTPNPATNVMTRYAYDLDGNLVDSYAQGVQSGSWVDTHYLYDANDNRVAQNENCVTVTNPCDGASTATQNVVTTYAYDAANNLIDTYTPAPGCSPASVPCVPIPNCSTGPPPTCTPPATPCPATTCVDAHLVYDTTGRVFQVIANYGGTQDVSQANVATTYAYDTDGRLTDIFTPITSPTLQIGQIDEHRSYDVLGRLVTDIKANTIPTWMTSNPVINTTPAQTSYTLDAGGRVISVTGPGTGSTSQTNQMVTTTDYDDLGRPLSVTADSGGSGHLNAVSRFAYDPRGAIHNWTPPTQQLSAGLETSTNYDLAGHATSVVRDDGSGGLHLTTSTSYDGYGRPTDVIDPRGIDTNTGYDALDRVTSTTQNYCPSGNSNPNCSRSGILADQNLTTSFVYDLAGNRTQVVNPRSIVQYTAYDALHRASSETQSCQTVPTPPSTSCGTQSSDQNVLSSQTFDQAGDVLTTTDPLNRMNVYVYDALGRKASQTINCVGSGGLCNGGVTSGQNLTTQWQYDAHGDVLKETSPRQCTIALPCYQGYNTTSITDGANLATGYTYDALYRLASVIEDQGHLAQTTTYTYDPTGNRLSQTDGLGSGHTTSYTVDNLGRTTKVTDANNYAIQTNYNSAGEVVSTVNGRGKTSTNTLDRVGRLVGVSYLKADGTTALSRSLGYDADGNQTSFSDTDVAQTTVSYDHLNRPNTVTAPSPYGTTTYAYFMDGAVNTTVDPNGTTTFTEDRLGRVASMVTPLVAGTTSYSYDAAGRLTSRTEANGIVTTVTYTGADQLASKTEVAGSTTLASWSNVTYDLAQNRTAETLAYYAGNPYPDAQAGTATYQYDTENQLSQATLPGRTTGTFGFDAAHNLTSNAGTTQAYNANESLQTVGGATTGSDADGNQVSDGNGHSLSWNSLSQLEAFATAETYTYDGLGRLTTVTNGSNVTKFVYQGQSGHVIQELNSSNVLVRSYAWDGNRQLYFKTGSNSYYQITNPHGDVVASASATSLAGTIHFDPWGNPTYTPTGTTTPFGFQGAAGSWTDGATSFASMGVRWYYPKVGEFLSSDPATGSAGARLPIERMRWLYGADAPLTHNDPTGLIQTAMTDGACDASCQVADAAPTSNARDTNQNAAPARIVYYGRGMPLGQASGCNIGSQTCGAYAGNFGRQLLNIGCGLTICPLLQSAREVFTLGTDPSAWWKVQAEQWNADGSYWSDQFNTIDRLSPTSRGGQKCLDCGLGLFTLKWSSDRIDDFQRDPGTASANIVVFFVTLAIPGPKMISRDVHVYSANAPEALGGSPVLLDTSAVKAASAARGLLQPGECAVICAAVQREALEKGFSTAGLPVIEDAGSITLRGQVAQQLRIFGADEVGFDGDVAIGATALDRGIPLITGDKALWAAVSKLGGDARWFAPGG